MKRRLLSALCAAAALLLFSPVSQAQAPANNGTGAGTSTSGGTSTGSTGTGTGTGLAGRRRGGGENPEEKHAREIIAKYDKDGDHALNATELAAFFEALRQRVAERRSQLASNNSASASSTPSPSAGTGQHAAGTPQEHAAKAIEKFDKNGDGKLEARELAVLLRAIRERLMEGRGGQRRTAPGSTTTSPAST